MKNKPAEKILYHDTLFTVTDHYVRTPRKTYQMNRIEKISVSHGLLYFGLYICAFIIMFYTAFAPLFTPMEAKVTLLLPVVILLILGRIATLYVTSKALAEPAVTWSSGTIYAIREAIETAMRNSHAPRDNIAHHDEDEDDVS